jgi:hypothetical protein
MIRNIGLTLAMVTTAIALSGCVVAGPGRPGCPWVPGHYGPEGGWHPGHCR